MKKIFLMFSKETQSVENTDSNPEQQNASSDPIFTEAQNFVADSQSAQMFSLLDKTPEMLKDPKNKEFYDVFKASLDLVNKGVQKTAEKKVEVKADAQQPVDKQQSPKKNVFLGGAQQRTDDFSGVTKDTFVDLVKSKFGIDGADENEIISKFLSSASTQRNQASEAGQVQAELKQLKSLMENLPQPLAASIKAFATGDSWEKALNTTVSVNYNKPFKDLSPAEKSSAIEAMTGNKIVDTDLDKPENTGITKAAERAFETERENIRIKTEAKQREFETEKLNLKSIVSSSIESLKTEYPSIDSDTLNEINDVIETKGINSLFVEKYQDANGVTKVRPVKDIALRVALVLHGKEILNDMVAEAEAMAKASTKADILQKSSVDERRDNNGNNKDEQVNLEKQASQIKSKYIKTATY